MATANECHASMGALIFAFQELEHELVNIFVRVVAPPELQKLSKNYVSFGELMDKLLVVADRRLKDKTTKKRLEVMVRRATHFATRRNLYVHSHYDMTFWDWQGMVRYSREKGRFGGKRTQQEKQYESFNPDDLYRLAGQIQRRVLPVSRIFDRINDELCPGWREEEFLNQMHQEQFYDEMEIPEEIYESFQRLRNHVAVGSVKLPSGD
jgi:hypothetical protein